MEKNCLISEHKLLEGETEIAQMRNRNCLSAEQNV